MAHLVTFRSSKFDVTKETPNPINPIAGESVLLWLRDRLQGTPYEATAPETEDWGWYVYVRGAGATYLVGASADADDPSRSVEWTLQVHKQRSLKDRITGANKLVPDDPLSALIERLVRAERSFEGVEIAKRA